MIHREYTVEIGTNLARLFAFRRQQRHQDAYLGCSLLVMYDPSDRPENGGIESRRKQQNQQRQQASPAAATPFDSMSWVCHGVGICCSYWRPPTLPETLSMVLEFVPDGIVHSQAKPVFSRIQRLERQQLLHDHLLRCGAANLTDRLGEVQAVHPADQGVRLGRSRCLWVPNSSRPRQGCKPAGRCPNAHPA